MAWTTSPQPPQRGSSSRPAWADKALPSLGEGWEETWRPKRTSPPFKC